MSAPTEVRQVNDNTRQVLPPQRRPTFELQFQGDDRPVLGLFPVAVPVEGELHGRLHPLDLGGGCPVQLLHLRPAALAWTLHGRQHAPPGHPVHVLVGQHIALPLLSLQLLLLLCRGKGEKMEALHASFTAIHYSASRVTY